jgi:hypothetical protein
MRRPPDGAACPSVASREGGCDHPSKLDSSLESCFSKFPQINFQINIKTKPQITNTLVLSLVFGFWFLNIGTYLEIGSWKFPSLGPRITLTSECARGRGRPAPSPQPPLEEGFLRGRGGPWAGSRGGIG